MPAAWVNVVHHTQTSHHPDPYDPSPTEQGITQYYGRLVYGGVDFAILADRQYKTGPEGMVPPTGGRGDHVTDPNFDPKTADLPGLQLLGADARKIPRRVGRRLVGRQSEGRHLANDLHRDGDDARQPERPACRRLRHERLAANGRAIARSAHSQGLRVPPRRRSAPAGRRAVRRRLAARRLVRLRRSGGERRLSAVVGTAEAGRESRRRRVRNSSAISSTRSATTCTSSRLPTAPSSRGRTCSKR